MMLFRGFQVLLTSVLMLCVVGVTGFSLSASAQEGAELAPLTLPKPGKPMQGNVWRGYDINCPADVLANYEERVSHRIFSEHHGRYKEQLASSFQLTVEPNGEVSHIVLLESSGNGVYDERTKQAVLKANPLQPIPSCRGNAPLELRITFNYVIRKGAEARGQRGGDLADRLILISSEGLTFKTDDERLWRKALKERLIPGWNQVPVRTVRPVVLRVIVGRGGEIEKFKVLRSSKIAEKDAWAQQVFRRLKDKPLPALSNLTEAASVVIDIKLF